MTVADAPAHDAYTDESDSRRHPYSPWSASSSRIGLTPDGATLRVFPVESQSLPVSAVRILLIDDDDEMLGVVAAVLEPAGFRVEQSLTADVGIRAVAINPPDLILLDVMLPGRSGLDVCRRLRAREATAGIPVLLLTARNAEADILTGFEAGADAYLTKPVHPRLLLAHVRAALRRLGGDPRGDTAGLQRHGLSIHPGRHEIRYHDAVLTLSATEFKLLQVLMSRPGWVYARQQLIDVVHAGTAEVTDRCIDVQISTLRRKLENAGALIETVRGVGYRFRE